MSRRSSRERKKPESVYDEARRQAQARGEEEEEGEEEGLGIPSEDESEEEESQPVKKKATEGRKRKSSEAQSKPQKSSAPKRSKSTSKSQAAKKPRGPRKKAEGEVKRKKRQEEELEDEEEQEEEEGGGAAADEEDEEEEEEDSLEAIMGGKAKKRKGGGGGGRRPAMVKKEGAFSRGKNKKEAVSLEDLDEATHSLLYERVVRGMPVENLLENLVSKFEEDESSESEVKALVFDFLVWSSGGTRNYTKDNNELPMKEEDWDELIESMVEDMQHHDIETYPLETNKPAFKKFRANFTQMWRELVMASRSGDGYHVAFLDAVVHMLNALSVTSFVAIRHTATFGALALADALVKETKKLTEKEKTHNRQLEAEITKAGAKSRKAQGLRQQIEQVTSRIASLETLLRSIIEGVFTHRYRDINEKVRIDCMVGVGNLLEGYPLMFLKDQYLKYVGWTLYDKGPSVRLAAAEVLDQVYSEDENMETMANFTTRFLGRLIEMIQDTSEDVQTLVIRILRRLLKHGSLDDTAQEVLDEVDEKLLDARYGPVLREQAMLFFTDHAEHFNDEEEEGDELAKKGSKKKSLGTTSAAQGQTRRARLSNQLTAVVQLLDYHLKEDYTRCQVQIKTCVSSFEMHPEGAFIFDWPTYFDLLKEDKGFSDQEQSILIALLVTAVEHAAEEATDSNVTKGGRGRGGKKKAQEREARVQDALEAFTAGAVEVLPKLLTRFQTSADKTAQLAKLPQYLQPHTIESKRNKANFAALLKLLRDIYLKAITDKVLLVAATSLRHLLTSDTQKQLQVDVTIRQLTQSLVERLQQCLSPSKAPTGRGSKRRSSQGSSQGSPSSPDQDQDTEYSLGLTLMRLRCLLQQLDLEDYMNTADVTALIHKAVSDRVEVSSWPVEERLKWTMQVIEEGMQALFVMLTRATNDLMDKASEKFPKKAAKEEDDEEEDDEEETADAELDVMGEKVVTARSGVTDIMSTILAEEVVVDGNMSKKRAKLLNQTLQQLQEFAFKVISDLRFIFRPRLDKFMGMEKIVWSPDPEFLRLLQNYFKKQEARYDAADEDPEVDEALVKNLLDPLMRSVLYTTEALNRRQAAAAAVHFVHSGSQSAETVKWFMKQLKAFDPRLHLEVQMSTLRSFYTRWVAGEENGKDGLAKFEHLARRLAQTMGVGRVSNEAADSFMRFLTSGISVAFEEPPKSFSFLKGLNYYASRIMEGKRGTLIELFESKVDALPDEIQDQLNSLHPNMKDEDEWNALSPEWQSFILFREELKGPHKKTFAPTTQKRKGPKVKRGRDESDEEEEEQEEDEEERQFGEIEGVIGRASSTLRESVGSRNRRLNKRSKASYEEEEAVLQEDDIEDADEEEGGGGQEEEEEEERPRAFHQPVRTGRPSGRSSSRGTAGRKSSSSRSSKALPALSEDEEEEEVEDFDDEDNKGKARAASSSASSKKRRSTTQSWDEEGEEEDDDDDEEDRRSMASHTSSNYSLFGEMGPPKPSRNEKGGAKKRAKKSS